MTVVYGAGRTPNLVLLCGEAPGREEARLGRPFVGRSGDEQEWYLSRHSLTARAWYRTNVVKTYLPDNPDPTPELVDEWTPYLLHEVDECAPRLIVTVGRFASRFFLGDDADMERVHGVAHRPGAFDSTRTHRAPTNCTILPVHHPAFGLHDAGNAEKVVEKKSLIAYDYAQLARILTDIKRDRDISYPTDRYPDPCYTDVSGGWLAGYLHHSFANANDTSRRHKIHGCAIALDTEGTPDAPWSIQISIHPGTAYVLRTSRDDFARGIRAIQALCLDPNTTTVLHNGMYDIEMSRVMGLDLRDTRVHLFDSMYAAYLLRMEPQGLKSLAWRWCGMRMRDYEEVVGDIGISKQIAYLSTILNRKWPRPAERVITENDGTCRVKQPQSLEKAADRILSDYLSGKTNKDGTRVDIMARWKQLDREIRTQAESVIGRMPIGTLDDIPLRDAIQYSARDADATLRLYNALVPVLDERDVARTMSDCMDVLPVFEEMQSGGMPASRKYFEAFHAELNGQVSRLGARISRRYNDGRPFNPNSSKQVAVILKRQGLSAGKRTKTGKISTGKQSIEHLRFTNAAFADIFNWRELAHLRDAFCGDALNRIPPHVDIQRIRFILKTTRTHTRRPSSTDPNILAIPARTKIGRRVRSGYIAPPGMMFVSSDLSQIEMRVMAHESRDRLLIDFFRAGKDIHAETASRIFDTPLDLVTDDQRTAAKTANFGIIYGLSGSGLLTRLQMMGARGWTERQCVDMIASILHTYQGIYDYIQRVIRETRETGIVRDCWGMTRHLAAINHPDRKIAAEAGRMAVSQKIQGGAQGYIQRVMAYLRPIIERMQREGKGVSWVLEVHDELLLLIDESLQDEVRELVLDAMRNHGGMTLRVPVEAKCHIAKSWGELK